MKNWIYHPISLTILFTILRGYMLFVRYTTRWKIIGEAEIKAFWEGNPVFTQESWEKEGVFSDSGQEKDSSLDMESIQNMTLKTTIDRERKNKKKAGSQERKNIDRNKTSVESLEKSDPEKEDLGKRKGGVGGFWHGRLLMITLFWSRKGQQQAVMSSLSRDGDIGAGAAKMAGMRVFRGSAYNSKKQGKAKRTLQVYREMLRFIAEGGIPFLTLDGPRGPRMRGGAGLAHMSKFSGAPILLFTWSKRFRIVFKSWDRFILPLPFGRGVCAWEVLPPVPKGASDEALKKIQDRIETVLNNLCARVDQECGVEVIKPAEKQGQKK